MTACIYFSLFALFWQLLGMNYQVAVTITYLLAVLFHFSANRRFTFKAHGANLMQHLGKYACMVAINYLITLAMMHFIVEVLHFTPYAGLILSVFANTNANFLMSRYWVFRTPKTA